MGNMMFVVSYMIWRNLNKQNEFLLPMSRYYNGG